MMNVELAILGTRMAETQRQLTKLIDIVEKQQELITDLQERVRDLEEELMCKL